MFHHPPYFFCIFTKIVLIYKIIFASYYTIILKKTTKNAEPQVPRLKPTHSKKKFSPSPKGNGLNFNFIKFCPNPDSYILFVNDIRNPLRCLLI